VALVERGDFASGTSSRSSKLIHGGLRYLREGKIGLTRESVRERQELLRDAPGLVDPVPFLVPHYRKRKPGRAMLAAGLAIYDVLAGSWQHREIGAAEALALVPSLDTDELEGAHCYLDATTDDAPPGAAADPRSLFGRGDRNQLRRSDARDLGGRIDARRRTVRPHR